MKVQRIIVFAAAGVALTGERQSSVMYLYRDNLCIETYGMKGKTNRIL